jgi:hypothetical protein
MQVLLLRETCLIGMRSPDKPSDVHAAPRRAAQDVGNLGPGSGKPFVGIAAPVREMHPLVGLQRRHHLVETLEIDSAVDKRGGLIPLGVRTTVVSPRVDRRIGIAPLSRRQEPPLSLINAPTLALAP